MEHKTDVAKFSSQRFFPLKNYEEGSAKHIQQFAADPARRSASQRGFCGMNHTQFLFFVRISPSRFYWLFVSTAHRDGNNRISGSCKEDRVHFSHPMESLGGRSETVRRIFLNWDIAFCATKFGISNGISFFVRNEKIR